MKAERRNPTTLLGWSVEFYGYEAKKFRDSQFRKSDDSFFRANKKTPVSSLRKMGEAFRLAVSKLVDAS